MCWPNAAPHYDQFRRMCCPVRCPTRSVSTNYRSRSPRANLPCGRHFFGQAVFASVLHPLARLFAAAVSRASRSSGNEVSQRPVQQLSGCQPIDRASVLPKNASLKAHKRMSATTVALDVACGGVSTAVVSAILNPTASSSSARSSGSRRVAAGHGARRCRRRPAGPVAAGPAGDGPARAAVQRLHEGHIPSGGDGSEEDASPRSARRGGIDGLGIACANAVDVVKVNSSTAAATGASSPRCATRPVRGRRPRAASGRGVPARAHKSNRGLLHYRRGSPVPASAPRGAAIAIGVATTTPLAKSLARHAPRTERCSSRAAPPW